jgi:diadenosine tetraphosphatase ApaH/serine/threonine PP2A family protein phosphatase
LRVGIVSDIHGNLEALQAVLTKCKGEVDEIICLGDVVGYGADPCECLDTIQDHASFICAGNHDWAAGGRIGTGGFNSFAADAIVWTREQLTPQQLAFLHDLLLTDRRDDVLYVHGSPYQPNAFHYLFGALEASFAIDETDARLTFVGHSHRAFVYQDGVGEVVSVEGQLVLAREDRTLVNVGSVGQPRDQDPRAAFCVWNMDRDEINLVRVPYDVSKAQNKILDNRLPDFLAHRLKSGS